MWDKVAMYLKAQITLCRQLISLSESQKQALIAGDLMEMTNITNIEEQTLRKFSALEESKQLCLNAQKQKQQKEECCTLLALVQYVPQYKDEIVHLADQLDQHARELQILTAQNHALLHKVMHFVDFNINVMTQTTADDIYAPKAQDNSVISKKKIFDQSI